jgi:hypothetical protein
MNVYIFQAALLCEECGKSLMADNTPPAYVDPTDQSSYSSDDWPKGPYPDGGGEADCPQHCDCCGKFLENPLTGDGIEYVRDATTEPSPGVSPSVSATWSKFYRDVLWPKGHAP